MNVTHIYVFSDESGVFDQINNDTFVYAGIIFTDLQEKNLAERRYRSVETRLRKNVKYKTMPELKASKLDVKDKRNLLSSIKDKGYRFAVVIKQKQLSQKVFATPKTKERYLDWAFKLGLKEAVLRLISIGEIQSDENVMFHIEVDEHSTSTDGKYSLEEGILKEFRDGTQNWQDGKFFPPILPNLKSVKVQYRQSENTTLIRTADIIANRVYSVYRPDTDYTEDLSEDFLSIKILP